MAQQASTSQVKTSPTAAQQEKTSPKKTSTSPCRTLTIIRLTHAHKDMSFAGLRNVLRDAAPVQILLDGVVQGKLEKDQNMVLQIDSGEHKLAFTTLGSGYRIPAGYDDYKAFFFNNKFGIAPTVDPFRDQLTEFVLRMVRGQGFRERILDPNNRNHAVEVRITDTYIEVFTALAKTKGLAQWTLGGKAEKIYYQDINLMPLQNDRLPDGYWHYIDTHVSEAIENDEEADLTRGAGGFTIRSRHNLY